jgi:MFS family permease
VSPRRRVARLMFAGLVDSLCLSFAWTVLLLQIVTDHGLGAAGLVSAAMLVGVALSAPVASRLACHLDGRRLLRSAAAAEALLRVAVFALLATGAPLPVLVVSVGLMNVLAWTGYAGMRAEVAAVSPETSALTWYGTGVAAIEAVGAAAAALLPLVADVDSSTVLVAVTGVYVLGLLPTVVVAGGSPVRRAPRRPVVGGRRPARSWRPTATVPVAAGVLLMLAASAPTLLAVGLAAELHGRASVALVAVAFTVGSLAAPLLSWRVQRRRANGPLVWLLCAVGMTVGWVLAPWSVALMMVAQAASGLCMTALEGLLDTSIATGAGSGVTGALARGTAGRALGSAAAVAVLPPALAQVGLTTVMIGVTAVLCAAGLVLRRRQPAPAGSVEDPTGTGGAQTRPAGKRSHTRWLPIRPRTSAVTASASSPVTTPTSVPR